MGEFEMAKILAIDGNNVLSRAYYAIHFKEVIGQVPKNGVMGFLNMMLRVIDEHRPDYIFACFDCHAPTFRKERYEEYKAGRKSQPEGLTAQFPILKEILGELGVVCLELEGYEADDILGTISRQSTVDSRQEKLSTDNCQLSTIIMSGDKDCLQLIDEHTSVLLLGNKLDKFLNLSRMLEEYGITPKQYIDVKTLMGDSSDNIKGAEGIGEATAFSLIRKFGSIENIYANLGELTPGVREKMEKFADIYEESKFLVSIDSNVPIDIICKPFSLKHLASDEVLSYLRSQGLPSVATRIKQKYSENTDTNGAEQISWF